MMDVCLPGTGGMMPVPGRYLSCCYVASQGIRLLIDCGEGTQMALRQAGIKLSKLDALLLTHFHADHVMGLPGLLLSLANNAKTEPLIIAGPKGLPEVLSRLLVVCPPLPYPIHLVQWTAQTEGFSLGDIRIESIPLSHGTPCFGYKIALRRKFAFDPHKAAALGVPVPLYKTLHAGEPVSINGKQVMPQMVSAGLRSPLAICYMTDTRPSPDQSVFAKNADLLICDAMHAQDAMKEKAHANGHMVFADGAQLARLANVSRLWLTHFSPALKDPASYVGLAQALFPHTQAAYDGIRITL